jgi:hypothetical protein
MSKSKPPKITALHEGIAALWVPAKAEYTSVSKSVHTSSHQATSWVFKFTHAEWVLFSTNSKSSSNVADDMGYL